MILTTRRFGTRISLRNWGRPSDAHAPKHIFKKKYRLRRMSNWGELKTRWGEDIPSRPYILSPLVCPSRIRYMSSEKPHVPSIRPCYNFMSCWCFHVFSCHDLSCCPFETKQHRRDTTSCHVLMSCCIPISCNVLLCHVMSVMSYLAVSCNFVLCHVVLFRRRNIGGKRAFATSRKTGPPSLSGIASAKRRGAEA